MNAGKSLKLFAILCMVLAILAACGPKETPTPIPSNDVQIVNIVENNNVAGQIVQKKVYNQCESGSPFKTQFQFNQSSSETKSEELDVSAGASGEYGVSQVAKVAIEYRAES